MVIHALGKGEPQVQFLLGAPQGDVAHQVEQQTENLCVVGSSPTVATISL